MRRNTENTISLTTLCGLLCGSIVALSSLSIATPAHAKVFKCVEADGSISYNQMPCPVDAKKEEVIGTKKKAADEDADEEQVASQTGPDCRIANNFTRTIATQMIANTSSGKIFNAYGGVDSIPRSSIGVISYVFSHKGKNSSVETIAALSKTRCEAGSYGSVTCNDFPGAFIQSLGGCEQAANKVATAPLPNASTQANAAAQQTPPVLAVKVPAVQANPDSQCQSDIQAQLADIENSIENAETDEDRDYLAAREAKLQSKLGEC